MKQSTSAMKFSFLATISLCLAGPVLAQDPQATQSDQKPKPAARAYGPIGAQDEQQDQASETLQPDERSLTGFQQPTVGTPAERHSYWVPGVSYYNFVQSNGQSQGGDSGWNSTSYLAGNVSLFENWGRAQLLLNYSGGGNFSTDDSLGNGWFQQLSLTQAFKWRRWKLTFLDEFSYLPQSQFGFGAGTGLSNPGIGGTLAPGSTGLGGQFDPGQSIFTAVGPRYTNTFGTQVDYALTPRSSLTFGGIVSLLRFTESGNVESNNYLGNIGYNYQITRADTIGIVYRYNAFHYLGFPQAIGDQSIQAAYGRKITGRLALQLTGGPEITHLRIPQGLSNKTRHVAGTVSATFTYAFEKGSTSISYLHGVTPGSGVFVGATTDQVTGTVSRKLSRVWSGNANLGFSRNRNIDSGTGGSNLDYKTVYAGASLARPIGRNANFSLGYTAYIETANGTVCAGPNCSSDFTTHQISVGLSWHTRPFVLH